MKNLIRLTDYHAKEIADIFNITDKVEQGNYKDILKGNDYPEREQNILSAFLNGYDSVRPFTNLQKDIYPYLCAVISAYWLGDMSFDEGNLKSLIEKKQADAICQFMNNMRNRLIDLQEFPLFA